MDLVGEPKKFNKTVYFRRFEMRLGSCVHGEEERKMAKFTLRSVLFYVDKVLQLQVDTRRP